MRVKMAAVFWTSCCFFVFRSFERQKFCCCFLCEDSVTSCFQNKIPATRGASL